MMDQPLSRNNNLMNFAGQGGSSRMTLKKHLLVSRRPRSLFTVNQPSTYSNKLPELRSPHAAKYSTNLKDFQQAKTDKKQ